MRAAVILLLACTAAAAQPLDPLREVRYCGPPARNADGSIKRSSAVVAAFKRQHPCPSTGLTTGPCDGWSVNHTVPLACGGCDAVWNLSWVPNIAKSSSLPYAVDRYERKVYAATPPVPGTEAACRNVIVPAFRQ